MTHMVTKVFTRQKQMCLWFVLTSALSLSCEHKVKFSCLVLSHINMSAESQHVSGFSMKYVRRAEDDRRREVEMFDAGDQTTDESRSEKKPRAVRRSCSTLALSVLYLLILSGITTRYVLVTLEKDELQNRYDELKDTFNALRESLCPRRWIRSGCSCYFQSSEEKSWFQGRVDCHTRGAQLVVINSPEEQEFVSKLSLNRGSWIGLRAQSTLSGATWKWVDGSSLTQTFVATDGLKEPIRSSVVFCDPRGTWTQSDENFKTTWICEKPISFCC
ncbi:CD209 antigen-like protein A isoform X2 [Paralichthys olivaceus]|uniref:CD209 antigen-like protein A isoform X2 n=1 Tax=Paralichthys olivaceus TaxID=8255 RepID=UPI0037511559